MCQSPGTMCALNVDVEGEAFDGYRPRFRGTRSVPAEWTYRCFYGEHAGRPRQLMLTSELQITGRNSLEYLYRPMQRPEIGARSLP